MVSATLQRTEEDGEVLLSGVAEAWREAQVEQGLGSECEARTP